MYSLEKMIEITGDLDYVDHLERIAFNALPTQISDDFTSRQYFQQANQVIITRDVRNFDINHGETDLVFGFLTGYPCCTSNLHQGWPKFTQNLWYGTPDGGLAALIYSPSEVLAKVNGGAQVRIVEETSYPMDGSIMLIINIDGKESGIQFPLRLRIPSWAKEASVSVNGKKISNISNGTIATINRKWNDGDRVELNFPMQVCFQEWYERSVSVERGPLVYALKIKEDWKKKTFEDRDSIYGKDYWEVYPKSKWNYGLLSTSIKDPAESFEVEVNKRKLDSDWYWNQESAPIIIKVKAKEIPSWMLYDHMAGPIPYGNMTYGPHTKDMKPEYITLIPYGCTTLRISEFPVITDK